MKRSLRVFVFGAVATLLGSTTASVRAAGLLNHPINTVTGTVTTVVNGTPLGSSGPMGPNGPLISTPGRPLGANTGLGIGSGMPITYRNDSESTSFGRIPQAAIKGTVDAASLPATLQASLASAVTAITNDSVTIATPRGPATLRLPPGSVSRSRMIVGSKVTVIPNSNGVSVVLRLSDAAPNPYGEIYVGTVQTVGRKTVTLRFRDGTAHSFAASPRLLQNIATVKGKIVALASSDGLSTRKLLTAKEINHVVNSVPTIQNRYIGRIVNAKNAAITLDLGKGTLRTLQCSACAGTTLRGVSLLPGRAVYAIGDPQGRLVNLAAIPKGTRIVGQVSAANPTSVSIMFGGGDITTLPCACTPILQGLGGITVGDPVIADLDQNATITSLTRFPDNGRVIGQVVSITAKQLDVKLPSGSVQSFTCNCLADRFDSALLGIGNTIALSLNADAQVTSINAATAAPTTAVAANGTSSSMRVSVPCTQRGGNSTKAAGKAQTTNSPCADGGERASAAVPSRGAAYVKTPMTAAEGCHGQDSSSMFIAVHDGRTQRPVKNAEVRLNGPASIALMSPSNGYVELLNIPAGTYVLKVRKTGFGEAGTAEFSVLCNEGVRVEANLRALPHVVRVIRIIRRQAASRVVTRQRQALNCVYASKAPDRVAKFSRSTTIHKTSHGYYTCAVKKARISRTSQR
ncbi:MAG: carboxypeptidase-like regulatory domain-containing protein [Candidatus Eremiobacteraeota bacterium]|nr:carboxypeptidase-like regulatory domain-containing protein [Candidatus Eremiobacteraeota bacterium]